MMIKTLYLRQYNSVLSLTGETLELDEATTQFVTARDYADRFIKERNFTFFSYDGGYLEIERIPHTIHYFK